MPLTSSARKALRQDRRRTKTNDRIRSSLKDAIRTMKKKPTFASFKRASSFLDRAARKHVIHQNKAARLKSTLAHLVR